MKSRLLVIALGGVMALLANPASVEAQAVDPQILLVPYAPNAPLLPHPAHGEARITLKGMLRNAGCAQGYRVRWDTNRNGRFDDDTERTVTPNGGSVYDIGRTFTVPRVANDSSTPVNLRVVNNCNNAEVFATYPLFTYAWVANPDPRIWTDEQREVMAQMALQEGLWYLHRWTRGHAGAGAQITGNLQAGGNGNAGGPMAAWAFAINGHLPAYPPGTINDHGAGLPEGWAAANDARWALDPYAETSVRLLNYTLARGTGRQNVVAEDEDNSCGYTAVGGVRRCNRLAGTTDNRGAYTNGVSNNTYYQGVTLGSLAPLLPALAGTPLQVGGLAGMPYENFIQELTDWLGYMQIDSGCGRGGWLYSGINGAGGCNQMDASTAQWGYIGLESAEQAGRDYGVFVNNNHKYSLADNMVANQGNLGGASYRSNGTYANNMQLTGGSFVASRWLGIHNMRRGDNRVPFPGQTAHTADRLRQAFDTYETFTAGEWNRRSGGWNNGYSMFVGNDYLCGNTNALYSWGNGARCGNIYAIYSHQKGYRTRANNQGGDQGLIGGIYDWEKEFTTYVVRNQDRNNGDYASFGRITDSGGANSAAGRYGGNSFSTPAGVLILTPSLFNPKPVAIGSARPATVVAGCTGGNNGVVTFTHGDSFHPSADARIVAYQWDWDAGPNGDQLWWDQAGAPVDWEGGQNQRDDAPSHRYDWAGTYTATLRVVDDSGQVKLTQTEIRVDAAQNVAPTAAHGGPYALEQGQDLSLNGTAGDPNLGCNDQITVGWDLDNDGQYDDALTADAVIPWATIQGIVGANLGRPLNITMQVRDSAGDEAVATTQMTVFARDPIAVGSGAPNPARCPEEVTFDASRSNHPNPERRIESYAWDVDGLPGVDGGGANPQFNFTYERFGTYTARLTVTDDRGNTATDEFDVEVSRGNQAPTARLPAAQVVLLEGEDLRLDGSGSTEPNARCGDTIVEYAWDLNGDGDWSDATDVVGANAQLVVPWATVGQVMQWPAVAGTFDPHTVVSLRTTDSFGLTGVTTTQVAIFRSEPQAAIMQDPNPAGIDSETGSATVTLDGRGSFSPRPGGNIAAYAWDLNDDGQFGDANGTATVLYRKIFDPIPGAQDVPAIFVRLRVTDDIGQVAETRFQIDYRVGAVQPTGDADPSDPPETGYHVLLGDGLTLNGVQSTDPNGDNTIQLFRWDLAYDANGNPTWDKEVADAVTNVTAQELAAIGIDAAGVYPLLLEVVDDIGLRGRDTSSITVYTRTPSAFATAAPNPAACNQRVTLDGTGSSHAHPGVDIVAHNWDFDGDGDYDDAQGAQVTIEPDQYTFDGPRPIGLQVTDSEGDTATQLLQINVTAGNSSPTANPGGPYAIAIGDAITLDGSGTIEPDQACGDRVVQYAWDVGDDGNVDYQSPDQATQQVAWNDLVGFGVGERGVHTVRLRATDRFGATTDGRVSLDVYNGPTAVAELTPARVGCSVLVEFDGGGSFADGPVDQGFAIERWDWTFTVNGVEVAQAQGRTVARVAEGGDEVRGTLVVTDASGRTDTTAVDLQIVNNNLAPEANAGGPYNTGPLGNGAFAGVTLDARGSTDPNEPCDEVVQWVWDTDGDGLFGADDVNGAGGLAGTDYVGAQVRDYTSPGWQIGLSQIVSVRACDTSGSCSLPAEAQINVLDRAPPQIELINPRDDGCVPGGNLDVDFDVRDPDGDVVTVELFIDGALVRQVQVDTADDGSALRRTITFDSAEIGQGLHVIELVATDPSEATGRTDAGGRVPFDREGPDVTIGPELVEDTCYDAEEVPAPAVVVADAIDQAPVVEESLDNNGCQRTRTITATDACGNRSQAVRAYRVAEPVEVEITGPDENELVAEAAINWRVVGPPTCANEIISTLTQDGIPDRVYNPDERVLEPGTYTLNLTVPDCRGNERRVLRGFRVNGPPVAVPVTGGHPNADAQAGGFAYVIDEGSQLVVDGGDSSAPERDDIIAAYAWDLDADGAFDDAAERTAQFVTDEDGFFAGSLQVTDGFGASHTDDFTVIVLDVDPVADPGGPYLVNQGEAVQFDGSGSRAGSAADPLSFYRWDLGDGSPLVEGAAATATAHTYAQDGLYDVQLEVEDEDSSHSATVQVTVRDVNATIRSVTLPDDLYDGLMVSITVDAVPGAPGDPIVAYEWDFDGDGEFESVRPDGTVRWLFERPGDFNATLRVRDSDSATTQAVNIVVRPGTFSDLFLTARGEVAPLLADQGLDARIRLALEPQGAPTFDTWVERGLWAERLGYRGNAVVALDELLFRLYRAQALGADFGDLLWTANRRFLREVEGQRADVAAVVDENFAPLIRADRSLATAQTQFNDDLFYTRVGTADEAFLARDLFVITADAFFYLRDAVDPIQDYQGFPIPDVRDPVAKLAQAIPINDDLVLGLAGMSAEWGAYLAAGGDGDPGSGRAELQSAKDLLDQIRVLVGRDIGLDCQGDDCLTDRESLDLQLGLMDLVGELFAAADQGIYVRNWQNMLTLAIKFRIEIAVLRIEHVCGANTALALAAREQQRILLEMVARGENASALLFYIAPERRCLVVREFNECIVTTVMGNEAVEYPPLCVSEEQAGGDGGDGGGGVDPGDGLLGDPFIPLRPDFDDIVLLNLIIRAFLLDVDVMNDGVRAQHFPNRSAEDFDLTGNGTFDINDADRAILMFIHDPVDADGDGLLGKIEVDCWVGNQHMDPENTRTWDNQLDVDGDCDGDRMTNGWEAARGFNPVVGADARHDRDADGVDNQTEAINGMDPLDPADGAEDFDNDGVPNAIELNSGMDPRNPNDVDADFDQDGLSNGIEANWGLDPNDPADADADPDGDGMSSRNEIADGRNPLVADCANDPAELAGRNDRPDDATVLGMDNRLVVDNGTICNGQQNLDEDWYRFDIDEANARVVISLEAAGNLDLRLFNGQNGGQIADSTTNFGVELISVPRGQLAPGPYLVRVRSGVGDQADYTLKITVVPPEDPCADDLYEGELGNNVLGRATQLGGGEYRMGATWVCGDERRSGDWYRLDVTDTDKTVHIQYARDVDGQLRLAGMNQDLSAFAESLEVQTTVQCINVRANGQATPVFMNVTASTIFSDGDDRVDYVMQVVDTNLELNPQGECTVLSGGLFNFVNWPTLRP
jgi:PKD repeat protein